jgi:hypothetical protein
MSLVGFSMGVSFWLNELIDFGWLPSAKSTFALSGELLFQLGHHFRGLLRFAKITSAIAGPAISRSGSVDTAHS